MSKFGRKAKLGNKTILAKIDKLRELNVGALVPLPQLVVVGDQSSGKSSVLESLTGFSFPRAAGLCTRYATQITCSRENENSVTISIIPRPDADEELKERLLKFGRRGTDLDNDELATIFKEANEAMGIHMKTEDSQPQLSAFSQDILKIEIAGPQENHLTVIDVPGIFRVATPGLTTETDITMIENMVKSYMANDRTIILAVMPCNVDIATQEILKLAEAADPTGVRTMGVLTKPDLVHEKATQRAVVELVEGKKNQIKLGYYIMKNRSADDETSSLAERAEGEAAFFTAPPWSLISERCGTNALRNRLSSLLVHISKKELPNVRNEIEEKYSRCKENLESMGAPRSEHFTQRQYLGKIASSFQTITQAALTAHYHGSKHFNNEPRLRLITRMLNLNFDFAENFSRNGHRYLLGSEHEDAAKPKKKRTQILRERLHLYAELRNVIEPEAFEYDEELKNPGFPSETMLSRIKEAFQSCRGPELGTFSGTILANAFLDQSSKWEELVVFHISRAITIVHDYIVRLLEILCPEESVRNQLWNTLLLDRLRNTYTRAMEHAQFLLTIEKMTTPYTYNHYFNDNLQKKRAKRVGDSVRRHASRSIGAAGNGTFTAESQMQLSMSAIDSISTDRSNDEQTCLDIHDTLASYYKVARKRFVDLVCQQVISFFLLEGPCSPLQVFNAEFVMGLTEEALEEIAGEDEETTTRRAELTRSVDRLSAALRVLRS